MTGIAMVLVVLLSLFTGKVLADLMKKGGWLAKTLKVTGLGLAVVYSTLLVLDVGSLLWLTYMVRGKFAEAGLSLSPYLMNALVFAVSLTLFVVIPTILGKFMTFQHKAFAVLAGLTYCGFMVLLFLSTLPGSGQVANTQTGDPLLNYFKDPTTGWIEVFDKSVKFHPRYPGVALKPMTGEISREYEKQQGQGPQAAPGSSQSKPSSVIRLPFKSDPGWAYTSPDRHTNLWVESWEVDGQATRLAFACAGWSGGGGTWGLSEERAEYLTDQKGRVYHLIDRDKSSFSYGRSIIPGEIYRFSLSFEPIGQDVKWVKFHHSIFTNLKLTIEQSGWWLWAENPYIPPPQPVPPEMVGPFTKAQGSIFPLPPEPAAQAPSPVEKENSAADQEWAQAEGSVPTGQATLPVPEDVQEKTYSSLCGGSVPIERAEVSAPVSSPNGAIATIGQSVDSGPFRFTLDFCVKSGDRVSCAVTATNCAEKSWDLKISGTRRGLFATEFCYGTTCAVVRALSITGNTFGRPLPPIDPIRMELVFANAGFEARSPYQLKLSFISREMGGDAIESIIGEFTNIPLQEGGNNVAR